MPSETLSRAVKRAADLPAADQDRIGRELEAYIEDLQMLRAMLDEGVRSLEKDMGREIDLEQLLLRARSHEV